MTTEPDRPRCPICSCLVFKPYRGRLTAQCAQCKSLERTRLLWLVLQELGLVQRGKRVLHIAPEVSLMDRFLELSGPGYFPCDLDPTRYTHPRIRVAHINLCNQTYQLLSNTFDIVIHNHVLEHVVCDVEVVMREFIRVMKPGAYQLFSVPFRGDVTREDLSTTLSVDARTKLFAQPDHMRLFGRKDFLEFLHRVLGKENMVENVLSGLSPQDYERASIPEEVPGRVEGSTVFVYRKPR